MRGDSSDSLKVHIPGLMLPADGSEGHDCVLVRRARGIDVEVKHLTGHVNAQVQSSLARLSHALYMPFRPFRRFRQFRRGRS